MSDVEISELDELSAEKVSAVGSPANGTPWLLLKSTDVEADPKSPHTESPEADAEEDALTKAEADEIESMLTKAVGFCGIEECEVCKDRYGAFHGVLLKAKLKAGERNALPKSTFAIPEKAPGSGSYPITDKSHAQAALRLMHNASPQEQKRIKAKVHARFPGVGAEKGSPGVPDFATETPTEHGHLTDSGISGLAGPVTAGTENKDTDPSFSEAGRTPYVIPDEAKVNTNPPMDDLPINRPGIAITGATKSWEIEVVDKSNWMSLDSLDSGGTEPGSAKWEDTDAATLDSVARGLAAAKRAVMAIRDREMVEAISGDPHDWFDVYKLECAGEDICSALSMVATLAYHEAAEGTAAKAGRRLSQRSESAIRTARDHLSELLGEGKPADTADNGATTSEEENIMTTVTKEELDLSIAASVQSALKAERKAEAKKAKKKAKKMPPPFMAEKNANNGGDITEQAMRGDVHGAHDANDVNSIPNGGHVDGQYVNKQGKKGKTIKGLASSVDELKTLVSKMANAPRPGGPVLDGQARGAGVSPASEARFSETVAKGLEGDPEFVRLEKALAESKDPMERDQLSRQVTLRRLTRGHEMGLI